MGENIGLMWVIISVLLLVGISAAFFTSGMSLDPAIFSSERVQ